jgi:hypothetical protein
MFYNVENFYDTIDDPQHNDEDYLPTSLKKWNYSRYRQKTLHVFKTIVAIGGIEPPEIIGFAELKIGKYWKTSFIRLLWKNINIKSYTRNRMISVA